MAIAPNTTFVAGNILTAAQQNAFGFGIVAFTALTAPDTTVTVEEVQVTSSSFTAIANRYYKITYYEPELTSTATSYMQISLRKGNTTAGTLLTQGTAVNGNGTTTYQTGICVGITTLTAGAQTVCGTLTCNAGTGKAARSATNIGFILVEDIGPA